jgi:hypothetical protein
MSVQARAGIASTGRDREAVAASRGQSSLHRVNAEAICIISIDFID